MDKASMLNALQQHFSAGDPKDFATLLGVSPQVLSNWKNRNTFDIGTVYTKCVGIDPHWLLTGEGKMLKDESPTAIAQQAIRGQTGSSPLISIEAAAGFGNAAFQITEKDIEAWYIIPGFGHVDFSLRIKGDSMKPKYESGDIIGCRILQEPKYIQWNKAHVIATREQGILVKRLKRAKKAHQYLITSDNKEYGEFELDRSEVTGIALVLGLVRFE